MSRQRTFIAGRDEPAAALALVRAHYGAHAAERRATDGLIHSAEVTLGLELKRYLQRVATSRRAQSLALGSLDGWARVACHVAARIDGEVTLPGVERHLSAIGVDVPCEILEPEVEASAAALAAGALKSTPQLLGEAIQLTAAEREEHRIRRMLDACDETASDRRRRQDRERKSAKSAPAKRHSRSIESERPWEAQGISRRTWFRRQADGTVNSAPLDSSIRNKSAAENSVPNTGAAEETVPKVGGRK